MNKLLGVILASIFIFSFVKPVLAACSTQTALGSCGSQASCFSGVVHYCCGTQIECDAITKTPSKNEGQGVLPKTESGVDPTSGCTNGINTAIGCISVLGDQNTFLAQILGWAVGVGGGIAFLLIVYAGFMIMSSSGNPDRLKAGQELMTSAISGIVLLVLSIFVLRVIGVDILKIPGFG